MSREHTWSPPVWFFTCIKVCTAQNCVSTELALVTAELPPPATGGAEPICRDPDYTPKPTSVPPYTVPKCKFLNQALK